MKRRFDTYVIIQNRLNRGYNKHSTFLVGDRRPVALVAKKLCLPWFWVVLILAAAILPRLGTATDKPAPIAGNRPPDIPETVSMAKATGTTAGSRPRSFSVCSNGWDMTCRSRKPWRTARSTWLPPGRRRPVGQRLVSHPLYTWPPNWTIGELAPGKDVIWLQVPFPSLPVDQTDLEQQSIIDYVLGCPDSPCAIGFPPNDIRRVANTLFLERHPDIRRLLESVKIPLADISRQNACMIGGENSASPPGERNRSIFHMPTLTPVFSSWCRQGPDPDLL